MTNSILFPTDFSNDSVHALDFAIDLCKRTDSKLILLNVVNTPYYFEQDEEATVVDLILNDLLYFSKTKLEGLKTHILTKEKIVVEIVSQAGEVIQCIKKVSLEFGVSKIIMGTKTTKDRYFKSSSYNIVKQTSIPLLTISKESTFNVCKTILFPFNERFMTLRKAEDVIKLAKLFKSKVILLGVSEANSPEKIQSITHNMMTMKELFDSNKIDCEVHFKSNANYTKAILDYCDNNEIGLIAVANNLPTALKENLSVPTAEKIINNAEIPVLTIPVKNEYLFDINTN